MDWANKTWIETKEEKEIIAPKVSAQSKTFVAKARAKLAETDYHEVLAAATQVMESVRTNETVVKTASKTIETVKTNEQAAKSKVQEVVQDERNQEMLDKAVKFGTAQLSKASAYASNSLAASHAALF